MRSGMHVVLIMLPLSLAAAGSLALASGNGLAWRAVDRFISTIIAWRFQPTPVLPSRPRPQDQAEADRQDLDDLGQLLRWDRSFSPEARRDFEAGRAAMLAAAGSLSRAQFWMGVSRLVALAGNGHTRLARGQMAAAFAQVPLRLQFFADGLHVVRADQQHADLLGARVLALDGRSVYDAFAAVLSFVSGTAEHARPIAPSILVSPPLLQVIWPETDGKNLHLRFEAASGLVTDRSIAMLPEAASDDEIQAWPSLLHSLPTLPWALTEPSRVVFTRELENNGLYLRLNATLDDADGPLDAQLAAVLTRAPRDGWRWVVLDLRFNAGGNYLKTVAFTRELPRHLAPAGTLWLLTGNQTFSAAITTLARAKYFARGRARIVGEQIGDRDQFWAERGAPFVLRNSNITIDYATGMHDWVNGCRSVTRCFWLNFLYGVAAGDLTPQTMIGWRFADFVAGRDTLLDWVRRRQAQLDQAQS